MRSALVAAVYRKSFLLSNAARQQSTLGEIVNLQSIDATRLQVIFELLLHHPLVELNGNMLGSNSLLALVMECPTPASHQFGVSLGVAWGLYPRWSWNYDSHDSNEHLPWQKAVWHSKGSYDSQRREI